MNKLKQNINNPLEKETLDYINKHNLIDKYFSNFCYYNSNSLTLNEVYNSYKDKSYNYLNKNNYYTSSKNKGI